MNLMEGKLRQERNVLKREQLMMSLQFCRILLLSSTDEIEDASIIYKIL